MIEHQPTDKHNSAPTIYRVGKADTDSYRGYNLERSFLLYLGQRYLVAESATNDLIAYHSHVTKGSRK